MIFNSYTFFFFLPLVFIGYWLICRPNEMGERLSVRLRLQNLFVVIVSYIFYGWWDWRFLILITITALSSYGCGILLMRTITVAKQKGIVAFTLVLNLGILAVFKYFNFFMDSAAAVFSALGFTFSAPVMSIILPVGISFYTFQSLSYVIDVYRKQIPATRDVVAFLAFISFFPQLVAGPIERATNLLPQFLKKRNFDYSIAVDGCRQMLWGFFKKMVIADGCAPLVNNIFLGYESYSGSVLLLGAILFSFQIYGDFSGYSDIAIGCAKLFGINLQRNFNFPYFSRNIAEFWRRWHISLTTWFKDYLYIPLGGSRNGKIRTFRNVFIIFLVSGLWHGANWTFIIWGAIHAILFIPCLLIGSNRKYDSTKIDVGLMPSFFDAWRMIATFLIVSLAWIFFRAPGIDVAYGYLKGVFSSSLFSLPSLGRSMLPWIVVFGIIEWLCRNKPHVLFFKDDSGSKKVFLHAFRLALYFVLAILCISSKTTDSEFIYFQF